MEVRVGDGGSIGKARVTSGMAIRLVTASPCLSPEGRLIGSDRGGKLFLTVSVTSV